jgi:thiol peroxidase
MATITLRGNPIHTAGELPAKGNTAPDFSLLRSDLSRASLAAFSGKKILNIFPSIDTPVCATSVRKFNKLVADKGISVLNISEDLPFAQKRFCGAEGIDKCETLSAFRSSFSKDFGVEIADGPLAGLSARAVLVLDEANNVVYAELVPEIGQEPNYDAALAAIG